jgi:hypothetical protein
MPQSQFPHSCVCDLFIYSQDRPTYFPAVEQADRSWEYINHSQTHQCGNWDLGRAILFREYLFRIFGIVIVSLQYRDNFISQPETKNLASAAGLKWGLHAQSKRIKEKRTTCRL